MVLANFFSCLFDRCKYLTFLQIEKIFFADYFFYQFSSCFNMENYIKFFKSFFKYLKAHATKCDSLITQADVPLSSLSNQTYFLGHIKRADPENEVHALFPDLRERLLGEVYETLENNLKSLWAIENEINSSTKELKMHLHQLEVLPRPVTCSADLDENARNESSSEWNCLHPSFDDLLAMATDAWRYYSDLWMNIHSGLLLFRGTDEESYSALKKGFVEDSDAKKHLKWILALTSYLIED